MLFHRNLTETRIRLDAAFAEREEAGSLTSDLRLPISARVYPALGTPRDAGLKTRLRLVGHNQNRR
jgi:hypothetical protein